MHPDEAGSWDNLHERFEVKRINHQEAYALDGACTNWAEEYFSRLRRVEIGVHHHIAGAYLLRYAQESSWRENNRRVSNGDQVSRVAALAMKRGKFSLLIATRLDAPRDTTGPEIDALPLGSRFNGECPGRSQTCCFTTSPCRSRICEASGEPACSSTAAIRTVVTTLRSMPAAFRTT
jgi:hypothetical protein